MNEEDGKIVIKIPYPPITSLVFEGGGVKGIAYAGALKVLKEKTGLLNQLYWVAGSSAGAMTALLVALNFNIDEIESEIKHDVIAFLTNLPTGKLGIIRYIVTNTNKISKNINHGINDGKELYEWIKKLVEKKLKRKEATFLDLKKRSELEKLENSSGEIFKYKNLSVIVTNAHKNKAEVFSWETTPHLQIADAVLASMSIPGFFYVRYLDKEKRKIDWNPTQEKINRHQITPYVDGGVLNNYPINIFQDYKYWIPEYYGLAESHHFNPSALGIRVDSKEEVNNLINIRYHESGEILDEKDSKEEKEENKFFPSGGWFQTKNVLCMASNFVNLLASDLNKVEQYCQMTIGINDCDIQTTQFSLTDEDKHKLKESGMRSVKAFFNEYYSKIFFNELNYNNRLELEKDIIDKEEIINRLSALKNNKAYEREILRLKLEIELAQEVLSKPNRKISSLLRFFESSIVATTSETVQNSGDEKTEKVTSAAQKKIEKKAYSEVSAVTQCETTPLSHQANEQRKSIFWQICCW